MNDIQSKGGSPGGGGGPQLQDLKNNLNNLHSDVKTLVGRPAVSIQSTFGTSNTLILADIVTEDCLTYCRSVYSHILSNVNNRGVREDAPHMIHQIVLLHSTSSY